MTKRRDAATIVRLTPTRSLASFTGARDTRGELDFSKVEKER